MYLKHHKCSIIILYLCNSVIKSLSTFLSISKVVWFTTETCVHMWLILDHLFNLKNVQYIFWMDQNYIKTWQTTLSAVLIYFHRLVIHHFFAQYISHIFVITNANFIWAKTHKVCYCSAFTKTVSLIQIDLSSKCIKLFNDNILYNIAI